MTLTLSPVPWCSSISCYWSDQMRLTVFSVIDQCQDSTMKHNNNVFQVLQQVPGSRRIEQDSEYTSIEYRLLLTSRTHYWSSVFLVLVEWISDWYSDSTIEWSSDTLTLLMSTVNNQTAIVVIINTGTVTQQHSDAPWIMEKMNFNLYSSIQLENGSSQPASSYCIYMYMYMKWTTKYY